MSDRRGVTSDGELLTQGEVERRILAITDQLDDLNDDIVQFADDAAQAKRDWEMARAKSRIRRRPKGGHGPGGRASNDEVDDDALVENEELFSNHLITQAKWESMRDVIFTKRDQIKALQTIAANIRADT